LQYRALHYMQLHAQNETVSVLLHLHLQSLCLEVCTGRHLAGLWSRSRDVPVSRLKKNCQRLGLGHLHLVTKTLMGKQVAPYAV